MWRRFTSIFAAVILAGTASLANYQTALAARNRDYSPREFRSLLHYLGYNVVLGDSLNDEVTERAIRQFQQRYNLNVDGRANPQTQNLAADLMRDLQASLNLVLKPEPPLPQNQFYGIGTIDSVRHFQKKVLLPETGIANLDTRERLFQEWKKIHG